MTMNDQITTRRATPIVTVIFALLLAAPAAPTAVSALDVPALTGRVVDQAGIVSGDAERALTDYLRRVEEASGVQIAVLTIPSLEGEVLEQYAIRVVDEWQLGQEGEDNGALLLVSMEEKRIRIEVGYGLEGRLTDAASGVIIREYLQPYFRAGEFDAGIVNATQAIASVATDGQEIAGVGGRSAPQQPVQRSGSRGIPLNLVFFVIIFLLGSVGRMGRRRGSGLLSALFWGSMLSGSSSRHRGPFGGGGFGGGGFGGGGGFSGGGGGFGGGGASGGW